MSDKGFALFVKCPRRLEELQFPHLIDQEREYEVAKTVTLAKIDYENFIADMLADRQFLEDYAPLCSSEPHICCLRVKCRENEESILAVPNGAFVDIAAVG